MSRIPTEDQALALALIAEATSANGEAQRFTARVIADGHEEQRADVFCILDDVRLARRVAALITSAGKRGFDLPVVESSFALGGGPPARPQ